jgi:hypothetical protein
MQLVKVSLLSWVVASDTIIAGTQTLVHQVQARETKARLDQGSLAVELAKPTDRQQQ